MKNDPTYQHQKVMNTTAKQYFIFQQLGSGTSAKVYLSINQRTNQQFAIKVIPRTYLNSDKKIMQLVKTQIHILKQCNNQNIIKCHDVFQTTNSIFIVLQYCNGQDMDKYLKKKKYLSQDHAVWYLKQMLNGFKGLHQIGAMHRDFKLPNLLLHNRVCKIADLGFAKQIKDEQLTNTILGTQITMAPQVLERKPYGINADIWSLGVVFYQMLIGKYPYKGYSRIELLKNIISKPTDFSQVRISDVAKDFIQGCLTYDPNKRITWKQIYNHPLLNKNSIQLLYGISNTSQIFQANHDFYPRQSFQDSEDSLMILRNSARKNLIIEEIQQLLKRSEIRAAMVKNSGRQLYEVQKNLVIFGVQYGVYLNKLIFPMKFLDLDRLSHIPQIDYSIPIYLIYKKSTNQIRQFHHVTTKRINIFKIELYWKQFHKSNVYNDLSHIIETCENRVSKLFKKIQSILKSKTITDERVTKQLSQTTIKRKQFDQLFDQYIKIFARNLQKVLKMNEKTQNLDLIPICQALILYLNKDQLTPERFDWSLSKNINYQESRLELLKKFQNLVKN